MAENNGFVRRDTEEQDEVPRTKRSAEELRKLLQDAEIRLRDKKADKKSAVKTYNEDIEAVQDEIEDILLQLEGAE